MALRLSSADTGEMTTDGHGIVGEAVDGKNFSLDGLHFIGFRFNFGAEVCTEIEQLSVSSSLGNLRFLLPS